MAITEAYWGSATITLSEVSMVSGTTSLQTNTTDGIYQMFVDFSNMTAADVYEFAVKEKTISTSSQRTVYEATVAGAQPTVFVTPSLILLHGWDATLKLNTGTSRSIAWSIRQVA